MIHEPSPPSSATARSRAQAKLAASLGAWLPDGLKVVHSGVDSAEHSVALAARQASLWLVLLFGCQAMLSSCGAGGEDNGQEFDGPPMEIVRVQRDILAEEAGWHVISAEAAPVSVDIITPSIDAQVDSSDRLALILPPPASVRIDILPEDGPVRLRAQAGVHLSLARWLARAKLDSLTVGCEVLVNGKSVWQADITTYPKRARDFVSKRDVEHYWRHVGGPDGLQLQAGDTVVLQTRLIGKAPEGLPEVRAGFAHLALERIEKRPRMLASRSHPNIIMLVMDTQRADRMSTFGYDKPTTPNATRLAARGLLYERAHSTSSWTWPSTASMLTGLLPEVHGVLEYESCQLVDELVSLPELLQEQGYTTAAFSANPLISPWRNFDQGFEHFEHGDDFRSSERVMPDALRWLNDHKDQRFFLYVHLIDPHSPHEPRPEHMQQFCGTDTPPVDSRLIEELSNRLRAQLVHGADGKPLPQRAVRDKVARWLSQVYDASTATGDWWLGKLLDLLDELQLTENTVIAFTGDHGEELLDHGLYEHAHALHQELVHVPLVLAGPGIPAGQRRSTLISNRHLAPTLARIGGAQLGDAADRQDLALAAEPEERPLLLDTRKGWWNGREFLKLFALRSGDWILHWAPEGRDWPSPGETALTPPSTDVGDGQWRLYNLSKDPGEAHDLSQEEPLRADQMRAAIMRRLAQLARQRPKQRVGAGAATRRMLEAIGYAGSEAEDE